MSPHILITENTTYCTDLEGVEVAASALPHLERWMREHAHELGYIHVTEAPTATIHRMLTQTRPPIVPTLEEM